MNKSGNEHNKYMCTMCMFTSQRIRWGRKTLVIATLMEKVLQQNGLKACSYEGQEINVKVVFSGARTEEG